MLQTSTGKRHKHQHLLPYCVYNCADEHIPQGKTRFEGLTALLKSNNEELDNLRKQQAIYKEKGALIDLQEACIRQGRPMTDEDMFAKLKPIARAASSCWPEFQLHQLSAEKITAAAEKQEKDVVAQMAKKQGSLADVRTRLKAYKEEISRYQSLEDELKRNIALLQASIATARKELEAMPVGSPKVAGGVDVRAQTLDLIDRNTLQLITAEKRLAKIIEDQQKKYPDPDQHEARISAMNNEISAFEAQIAALKLQVTKFQEETQNAARNLDSQLVKLLNRLDPMKLEVGAMLLWCCC
jgi:hypothetical protein